MMIDINKDYVITINREVGSGGRTVGRMLAQRLGVPFYDKALINALYDHFIMLIFQAADRNHKYTIWSPVGIWSYSCENHHE